MEHVGRKIKLKKKKQTEVERKENIIYTRELVTALSEFAQLYFWLLFSPLRYVTYAMDYPGLLESLKYLGIL